MTKFSLNSWLGLKYVADEMGCGLELKPDSASSYVPEKYHPKPKGLAIVREDQEDMLVIRDSAHELSHHTLYHWEMFGWRWHWPQVSDISKEDMEERICNKVADLIWPLPKGIQANGKRALPDLPGVVARRGWHKPAPAFMAMPAAEIARYDAALQAASQHDPRDERNERNDDESDIRKSIAALFFETQTNLNSPDSR